MKHERAARNLPVIGRRGFLVGSGLILASAVATARMPVGKVPPLADDALQRMVPARIGDWKFESVSGVVLPPSDALSDRLYDDLLTRTYTNSEGQVLMLLIAYNNRQDGVLQIHRPEFCYPAGGYTLTPTQPAEIETAQGRVLPANAFLARSPTREEQVLYWTRVGNDFPRRWIEQRWSVARANLDRVIPDGLLARVSVIGLDERSSLWAMKGFVAGLYRESPPGLRSLLFGKL